MAHELTLAPIDYATTTKARRSLIDKGHTLFSALCSCGHWSSELGREEQLKTAHRLHLVRAAPPTIPSE